MGLRERVMEKLTESPMSFDVLYDCMQDVENSKQLANALHRLKVDKRVVLGDDKVYRLADNAKRIVSLMPGMKPSEAALASIPRKPNMSVKISKDIETKLEELVTEAQATLDAYLYDLGDPRILGPLVVTRNGARDALTAYRSKINSRITG